MLASTIVKEVCKMTKQDKILNEFEKIEKNLNLCKNPNTGESAYIIMFNCDEFMLYVNELVKLVKAYNFDIYDIETDYTLGTVKVTITAKDTATSEHKFKIKTLLQWLQENDFIIMFI